jgi:protein required for attachment to host cells
MKPVLASYALVANRASASLYRTLGPGVAPELVRHFDHPEGRLKSGEINTDRPGRGSDSAGGGRTHAFTPNEGPVERVARDFATQLAKDLDHARKNNEYDQLALIAPPRMLGYLREAMDTQTRGLVYGEIPKDIDPADAMEARKHLDQLVAKA